jgi:sulfur relay (sulfurtransferase) DsrF/TusC family protein
VIVLTSVGASAVSSSVSITAPASGATVSGNVSVTATATDSVGVTKVELYVDGALSGTDTTTPYNFTWDSTLITAGSYTLMAKAYNTAGNAVQSDNVSVTVVNDTTTPTVSVIIPANNATVSGTVMISASASDNVGVSKVEFYEDGVLLTATNVAPYSYNWNTATVANGTHSLTAKAYDASTNVGQSSIVAVTVSNSSLDTTASTVSITAPANNATVRGTVSVIASATDNIGVVKVEFYVNGVLKKTDTAAPYTFNWNTTTLVDGSYTLLAKAYDAANNIGQSSNVTVTLNNPDTTAPTISITAPANNATVRGTVSVIASATDYIGVVKVEFYVNGVLKKTDTATPYSYIWNTRSIGKGNYTITAKAYDAAGNVGQSLAISVTVRW